jgi:hypothetical protein
LSNLKSRSTSGACALLLTALGLVCSPPTLAQKMSSEELAKLAQNPVGNLVSVPFQNNTNFNVGPQNGTQNILNVQPVLPIEFGPDWNLITRTILPLVWQPGSMPGESTTFGLGDLQLSGFVSPSQPAPGGIIWGAGPIVQMPTDSNGLGNKNWGLGPTAVLLRLEKGSPWVYGVLVNNVWSLSSNGRGGAQQDHRRPTRRRRVDGQDSSRARDGEDERRVGRRSRPDGRAPRSVAAWCVSGLIAVSKHQP